MSHKILCLVRTHKAHNRKIGFLPKFWFFLIAAPHICGSKNVPCVRAPDKKKFSTDYMHILKNFYYYHFLKCKTLLCTYIKSRDQRFSPKNGYFEPIIATPPMRQKAPNFWCCPQHVIFILPNIFRYMHKVCFHKFFLCLMYSLTFFETPLFGRQNPLIYSKNCKIFEFSRNVPCVCTSKKNFVSN